MRALVVPALASIAIVVASCGGSKSSSVPTSAVASPASAVAATSPAASSSTAAPATAVATVDSGTLDEVTGIVGSINPASHLIQINRLSGAPVIRISVASSTVIQTASGDTITLDEVHVSDRIVASGHLNDRQDTLLASYVTVQSVLPGAQPGG